MGGVSKITVRTTRHITFARVRAPRPGRSVVGSGASFSSSDASGSTLVGLAGPSAPSPSSSLDSVSDDSSSESSFFRLLPFVLGRLCKTEKSMRIHTFSLLVTLTWSCHFPWPMLSAWRSSYVHPLLSPTLPQGEPMSQERQQPSLKYLQFCICSVLFSLLRQPLQGILGEVCRLKNLWT